MVKKKGSLIPLEIRREMINKCDKARSICNQCELLGLARSTLYYTPTKTNDLDLKLMEELVVSTLREAISYVKGE